MFFFWLNSDGCVFELGPISFVTFSSFPLPGGGQFWGRCGLRLGSLSFGKIN